jgi:hypothetical protein
VDGRLECDIVDILIFPLLTLEAFFDSKCEVMPKMNQMPRTTSLDWSGIASSIEPMFLFLQDSFARWVKIPMHSASPPLLWNTITASCSQPPDMIDRPRYARSWATPSFKCCGELARS